MRVACSMSIASWGSLKQKQKKREKIFFVKIFFNELFFLWHLFKESRVAKFFHFFFSPFKLRWKMNFLWIIETPLNDGILCFLKFLFEIELLWLRSLSHSFECCCGHYNCFVITERFLNEKKNNFHPPNDQQMIMW